MAPYLAPQVTPAVVAEILFCADEKHIRTQSAILYENTPQAVVAFIHNRVFGTDALFIRTKNTVGARNAQVFRRTRQCLRRRIAPPSEFIIFEQANDN